jgi:hypothetical protein
MAAAPAPVAPAVAPGTCTPQCAEGSQCNPDGTCSLTPASPLAAFEALPPGERPSGKQSLSEKAGFFLQGRLNASFLFITDEYDGGDGGAGTFQDDYSGITSGISALVGGSPGAGFVLGGGLDLTTGAIEVTTDNGFSGDVDASELALNAFAQKFFGAFYLRALLGYQAADAGSEDFSGFTYGAGLGVDISIARKWAVGGGMTVRLARASYDNEFSGEWSSGVVAFTVGATLF